MQTFLFHPSYYVNRLISYISKIDFKVIESYMFPVGAKSNIFKQQSIDMQDFVFALEKIRESNIVISSTKVFEEKDWVDYIFDFDNEYQVILIDSFDSLLKDTKKSWKEMKAKIEKYSKRYHAKVILFLDEKELTTYKFSNWKVSKVNSPFAFTFDKTNYHIVDIDLKEEER